MKRVLDPLRRCRTVAILLVLSGSGGAYGAVSQQADSTERHPGRLLGVTLGGGTVIAGTLIGLDQAWYSSYQRVPFHFFNDGNEWLQMDKVGHAYATYSVGLWGDHLLRWSGASRSTSLWAGGLLGTAYLTAVEYMDGRSSGWGFSVWDMTANVSGSALYIGQELAWGEQRISMKYSAHLTDYADQRPDLLGRGLAERILKDYNGCTFWLSANLEQFGCAHVPPWLNVALGYGADGMVMAEPGPGSYRQFYLAPDVQLSRIPTKSKVLRTAFLVLDRIKVPLPALEIDGRGKVRGHALYF